MTLDVTVRINDVLFRSQESAVDNGDGFYIDGDGFEGWDDGVDVRRDEVMRPQAHGSFDVPAFLAARVVSLTGECWASAPDRLLWFGKRLTGLLAGGESGRVVVVQADGSTWATGRLAAKSTFVVNSEDTRSAFYQIQLWFADPRRFGESRTTSGTTSVAAFHYGNFPAAPVLTVTGSKPSGYTITGPAGKTFTTTKPVIAGSPHTIDMATGFLSVGGVVQSGVVTSGDTWAVPGGASVTQTLSGSGTATLGVTVRDTYI